MKTAAAIDALTRLFILAAMILFYQYFISVYLEKAPEKAWAPQLWRYLVHRWQERSRARVPEVYNAIRFKKVIELPEEPPGG